MSNFDEIDDEIGQWQSNLCAIRDNLFALYELPTYKRLDTGSSHLSGATAALVTPAFAAMNELFGQTGQLTEVVERAAALRHSTSHMPWSSRAEKQIADLLRGPSIQLPPVTTPLAQRGLLTAAEQTHAIAPERLLEAMTKAFDDVKSAVLAVDAAWSRLDPMLAADITKFDALAAMAVSLGPDAVQMTRDTERQIDALRTFAHCDPLSAVQQAEQIQDSLERLRAQLCRLSAERADLRLRLAAAKAAIVNLKETRSRADATAAKCQQCLYGTTGARSRVSDEQVSEMENWLCSLHECEHQGHWTALAKGLDRWEQAAREYTAVEGASLAADSGRLEALAELKGRLSALKIKVRKRGLTGHAEIARAEYEAAELLARPLVPLEAAATLVTEYENRLNDR